MKIKIPKTLIELSEIFKDAGSQLYLVGGYVRNSLLGFVETDMDICGPMPYHKVLEMLKNSVFDADIVNEKLGTLLIKSRISNDEFEYTTWRKESYGAGGVHSPEKVEFVKDIKQDALRRDFTCNCIYYDISADKIIDFGGVRDTLEHLLRTVNLPEQTFADDGLRILRLARMSAELNFSIEPECEKVVCAMISQLGDISQERFNKEVVSILFADYKYESIKNPNAPALGINLLSKWGAWGYILKEITLDMGMNTLNEKLRQPWVHLLANSPVIHRITIFTYEILKALGLKISPSNVGKILGANGLVLSRKEVLLQYELIYGAEILLKGINNDDELRLFLQRNKKNLTRMLDFAKILGAEQSIFSTYKIMMADKVPMTLHDLKINGNDIEKAYPEIPKHKYSHILQNLLEQCCLMPELNSKTELLNMIKRIK